MTATERSEARGGRRALGRGLAALLPQAEAAGGGQATGWRSLPIERLVPGSHQPRRTFAPESLAELAASIASQGVVQPLVVRRAGRQFEIVAGERRWRAASQAGLHEVPAIVRDLTDSEAAQVALVENLQREDLDPIDEALAFRRLATDFGLSHEAIGRAVGKSRPVVTNSLRLLNVPEPVLGHVRAKRLTAGHVRALLVLEAPAAMSRLADQLALRRSSVREAEARVRQLIARERRPSHRPSSPNHRAAEAALTRALGARVTIDHRRGRGHIRIAFATFDDLAAIIDRVAAAGSRR